MSKIQPNSSNDLNLIFQRLSEFAVTQPNKPALIANNQSITYSQLLEQVDQVTNHLNKYEFKEGPTIGLAMERSINMVIAMLSIWKSGAAFVPLDLDLPEYRINQILEDANPELIIGAEPFPNKNNIETFIVSDSKKNHDYKSIASKVRNQSIAYIMFTSGSTGRPKGVRVAHNSLENFLLSIQKEVELNPNDTFLSITSLSFDISILELVLPLIQGATLVLATGTQCNDGKELEKLIDKYDCTFLQATPATWKLLIDTGWQGKSNLKAICGGENFQRDLAEKLLNRCDTVFNAYGPTETTIWALIEKVESGKGLVPIGKPLSNYTALIFDDKNNEVKKGEVGQLFIGGTSLAIDYINSAQETSKYFIANGDYGRLYSTGDLVRKRDDDKLEFIGRMDHQVKIRGHRIELGDIQHHLKKMPEIKDVIVTTKMFDSSIKLLAYIIINSEFKFSNEIFRKHLKSKLPQYMIPNYFIKLDAFPLTHNKKIDYNNLPNPQVSKSQKIKLKDPIESFLQKTWTQVLGIPNISATCDFFELGGDSIQAALITNRLQDWLGELLWPVIIFDAPTIQKLSNYLKNNYPQAISKKSILEEADTNTQKDRVIDQNLLSKFNNLNHTLRPSSLQVKKNKKAIFLLCPPRSGSTLLRVMLAGHSNIFAPPEIEMLTFNTLKERALTFQGRESYRLEGLTRAIMEIKGCPVDEAKNILEEYEKTDISIHEFYGKIQDWLGSRILLDKTPANCLDLTALNRIEESFEDPLYIHLTRHPYGMIRSFLEARLSEVFFRRVEHPFSPRELAELVWYNCNNNIISMLKNIPPNRKFNISFEDLLSSPEFYMNKICNFLNIDFIPEMMEPHRNNKNKMTDGLHKESKMMGDPKFHQHKNIDSSVAHRWKSETPNTELGISTQNLASLLGYEGFSNNDENDETEDFIL